MSVPADHGSQQRSNVAGKPLARGEFRFCCKFVVPDRIG
jgi:hypothetical protein